MPLLDQIREQKLIELAKTRFAPDLTVAELKVLHDSASSQDLPEPDGNAPRLEVRAAFIRWLAIDPEAAPHIDPKGIRVYGVTLSGNSDLEGGRVPVRLDFRCCTAKGEMNLGQAETRDILFLNSRLEGEQSFHADTITIHGLLHLSGSSFSGNIHLGGAKIEGDLDCSGAKLEAKEGSALFADGANIGGDVFLRDGFESSGEIRMIGATIKGDLSLTGAKLKAVEKSALNADGTDIGGNVWFSKNFESSGKIRLRGARIGGLVAFFGASVARIDCTNLNISGDFYWMGIGESPTPHLDLRGACLKNMCDDEMSWAQKGHLFLNGLVYQELTLHNCPTPKQIEDEQLPEPLRLDAKEGTATRIQWLLRQPDDQCIKPQPWMQLSKYLDARGQHRESKHVLYEQKSLRAHTRWPGGWFLLRWSAIAFACLEEVLWRILCPIAITLLLGTLIFSGAYQSNAMVKTDEKVAADRYPPFQPFVYTLENVVPVAKLGIDDKYTPNPGHVPQTWFPKHPWLDWLRVFNCYWFLAISRWLLIFLGWFQAAVLGAALLGRFKQ
jgi:hypothetical protein